MDKSGKKMRKENNKNPNKHKPDKPKSEQQTITKKSYKEIPTKPDIIDIPKTEDPVNDQKHEVTDVLQISQPPENKFKKREIQSNWSKYEIPLEEDDSAATDFENMVQAPISVGGHFKFKSEKNMQADITAEYRDYFSLNINKLAENIETLPFYKRHELDVGLFTVDEIKTMDSKCSSVIMECTNKIVNILQPNFNTVQKQDPVESIISIQDISLKKNLPESTYPFKKDLNMHESDHEDDLDELLELKTPVVSDITNTDPTNECDVIEEPELKSMSKNKPVDTRAHLENWLDDLLQ